MPIPLQVGPPASAAPRGSRIDAMVTQRERAAQRGAEVKKDEPWYALGVSRFENDENGEPWYAKGVRQFKRNITPAFLRKPPSTRQEMMEGMENSMTFRGGTPYPTGALSKAADFGTALIQTAEAAGLKKHIPGSTNR